MADASAGEGERGEVGFETTHEVVVGDARSMDLAAGSVDLVVTSPPYPMIEMWDDDFASLSPAVADALDDADGDAAFEAMHAVLDSVWAELARVLREGGIACVNVGDATRKLGERFRRYPNAARITRAFEDLGFASLPEVLWRKPTNSTNKFMGSGMLPTNAYVTLEHEHVLVFRKGGTRRFEPKSDRRYESAYFWEERNEWFSDVWGDITGEFQALDAAADRDRSAAFPLEVPYRLVNMYSVYGDRVLDPFWGTGTTSLAALVCGRDSVGYELDPGVADVFAERARQAPALSRDLLAERLDRHRSFVAERRDAGESLSYEADHYDFPVMTRQERRIRFYEVAAVEAADDGRAWRAQSVPYRPA
ncbi:MAG: site-specific DNA-methyltransferase [Haloarculaceae archaeon]